MGKVALDITMPLNGVLGEALTADNRADNRLLPAQIFTQAHQAFPEDSQKFNKTYFCYQSKNIRLEIVRTSKSSSAIHLRLNTLN